MKWKDGGKFGRKRASKFCIILCVFRLLGFRLYFLEIRPGEQTRREVTRSGKQGVQAPRLHRVRLATFVAQSCRSAGVGRWAALLRPVTTRVTA